MKKVFLLMCATICVTLLEAAEININGVTWYYSTYQDGESTVVQIDGTAGKGDLDMPASINGKPVRRIRTQAFFRSISPNSAEITSMSIPEGVTTINNSAFLECTGLKRVTFPSTLTWIAPMLFEGCTSLTDVEIDIKNPCYSMKDGCLIRTDNNGAKCEVVAALETATDETGCLTLPEGINGIATSALSHNRSFTSVVIPSSVKTIHSSAFAYTALTSVSIPRNVETIEDAAFNHCSDLREATLPDGLKIIEEWTFAQCPKLATITIPASVTDIGKYAFFDSSNLSVTFEGNPPTLGHPWSSFPTQSTACGYYLKKNATAWETYFTTYEGGDKELGFHKMEEIDAEMPQKYFVYVHIVGEGIVGGSGWYEPGETVTMTAYASEGYTLCGWSKDPDEWYTGEGEAFTFTFTMPNSGMNVLAYFTSTVALDRHVQANALMTKEAAKDELLKSKEYYTADSLKTFVLETPEVKSVENGKVLVIVAVSDPDEHNFQSDKVEITRADDETTAFYKAIVVGDEAEEAPEDVPAETPEEETEEEQQPAA